MGDPFLYRSIAGIQEVIAPLRLVLVQALAGDEATELETYRTLAHDARVDGVFLIDLRTDDPRVPLLRDLGLPSVTLGPSDRPDDGLAGGSDITAALTAAVRELIAFGHTRIAFVTGPARLVHTAHRAEVITRALREAGLPAPVLEVGDYSAQSGADCTNRILAHRQRPTAILYANDVMAIGGMGAALDLGYSIPGDLSVLGMGDIELAGHVHPGLTSIRTDSRAIGAAAAHRLIAHIERDYVVPDGPIPAPELVRRGSVGPVVGA
jgi:DNA-binding LacI/PurR family transcriptional regulator